MDELIRRYFDGCNEADVGKITTCFTPEAVHYFPPGMYNGPFRGAAAIASRWQEMVKTIGSYWTVDTLLIEPVTWKAVMEWTHFKTVKKTMLRGIEVYEFDHHTGLISEIRAYYASPQAAEVSRQELEAFDYAARGYPMAPPVGAR
jgi:hypothetical protein